MKEWREIELGQCVNMISGGTPSKDNDDYWNGDIPWASAKDLKSFLLHDTQDHITKIGSQIGTRIAPKGAILILVRGMTLHNDFPVCRITQDMAFNQDIKAIIPEQSIIDTAYLAYWMLSSKYYLMSLVESASHGTGRINTNVLKSIKIPYPSLQKQKSIAQVLENFDIKIDNLRRQNETLEQIARSLFKRWFIDFEFPNTDGKPYKSSGGAMFTSELGDIPEGWKVGKLKDISDITSSKRIFSAEYVESGIPFYRSKEIIELHAGQNVTTELYISEEKFNEIKSKFEVPKADEILLTSVGTIGVPYLIKKSDQFYFKDGNLTWIKRFKNGFSGVVIYYWLKSDSTQAKIKQNTIGSTQKALTIQALGNISIFIPDTKTLNGYTEFIKIVNSKIENNIYQIQTLTKTRDSLLPKLMSGQLRVKE